MNINTNPNVDYGEHTRMIKLIDTTKQVDAFEHEGRIYLGNRIGAVKAFIKNNPKPADFSVWLQKNYKELS